MKRFFCAAVALLCLLCSGAAADRHMAIDCTFSGLSEGKSVTFDIYEQSGQTIALSSLFPDIAAEPYTAEGQSYITDINNLLSLRPDTLRRLISSAESLITDWLRIQQCEMSFGAFSGSLFEHASSMCTYTFPLLDFSAYLSEYAEAITAGSGQADTQEMTVSYLLNRFADIIGQATAETDLILLVRDYDEGRYCTVHVKNHDDVLMVLSFDHTDDQKKRTRIEYKENGRYCFIDYDIITEEHTITCSSAINTSRNSYLLPDGNPMIREHFILSSDSGCSFQWVFKPDSLKEALTISGTVVSSDSGFAEVNAAASIEGFESDTVQIKAYTEPLNRAVAFTDKRIIQMQDQTDHTEIQLAASSGLMALASEIYPNLPEDYQKLLLRLFYPQ